MRTPTTKPFSPSYETTVWLLTLLCRSLCVVTSSNSASSSEQSLEEEPPATISTVDAVKPHPLNRAWTPCHLMCKVRASYLKQNRSTSSVQSCSVFISLFYFFIFISNSAHNVAQRPIQLYETDKKMNVLKIHKTILPNKQKTIGLYLANQNSNRQIQQIKKYIITLTIA